MARNQATKIENSFINGLITENTALSFPEQAAVSTFDCVFDRTGRVSRRDGFDVEAASSLTSIPHADGEYVSEYLWETVGGLGTKSFLVLQTSSILRFYDVSTSTGITANVETFTVDLDSFLVSGSALDPATQWCRFTHGNGDLLVINAACEPFYVEYDATADAIDTIAIQLKYRDLVGVNDGLDISLRTGDNEAGVASARPYRYYNLVNQGWFAEALSEWDVAETDLPSNGDAVAFTRVSADNAYGTAQRGDLADQRNSQVPRGHFILDVFAPNRIQAMADDGRTEIANTAVALLINPNEGEQTGMTDADTRVGNAWDGDTIKSVTSCQQHTNSSNGYVGKNFTNKKSISQCVIYSSKDGYIRGGNPNVTFDLRASNTLPTDFAADGSSLGTKASFLDGSVSVNDTIASSDDTTEFQYVWIYITQDGAGSLEIVYAEFEIYTDIAGNAESIDVEVMKTTSRPAAVAFYASRVWYAGISDSRRSGNVYYSQLIEDKTQYGKCYQENDPTSEEAFDLLATDGGVVKIPEIGTVVALFTYQDSLLIFAHNGIWQVKGGSAGFAANDFLVRKISSIGTQAPGSIVDVGGSPLFWGDQGIYLIKYDFENDSFQAENITDDKIKTFITDIPEYNRRWVKGAYNIEEQRVQFIYSSSTTMATDNTEFKYTNVLVLDRRTAAYYPWTIGDNTLDIRGIVYIRSADRSAASIMKYLVFENVDATNEKIGFANQVTGQLLDWSQYAIDTATASEEKGYSSFFEVGHYVHAEGNKNFQANYITIFMETDTANVSSLNMQGKFDFSSSSDSNREGTLQQCYNSNSSVNLSHRDISMKKLKIRGKGRSLSLRFESETEKPFTIIGWSIYETANVSV